MAQQYKAKVLLECSHMFLWRKQKKKYQDSWLKTGLSGAMAKTCKLHNVP